MALPIVVHVITRLELGGAQQNTLDSCRMLDRTRFRVALLSGPDGILDAAAARIADLDFRIVSSLQRAVSPRRDLHALAAIRAHLAQFQAEGAPVIVHTHSSKAGILGRLAARSLGIRRVVHTIHGFGHPAFERRWMRRGALALERYLAPRTAHFVAVARANIEEGQRLGLFARTPVRLIRSGFDLQAFQQPPADRAAARRALGIDAECPLIGTLACLKPQKAPLDFVRAAAALHALLPTARFVIAGDGELRAQVIELAQVLGMRERIHLLGWREDPAAVLRALDVFWLTSRWEGLPRALVQAMAVAVPVVATAVDGVRDVLEHGKTGFAVAPGDAAAFAQHTHALLADATLRARITEAAAAIPPAFDVAEMGRRLEELYDEMLPEAAPGPS